MSALNWDFCSSVAEVLSLEPVDVCFWRVIEFLENSLAFFFGIVMIEVGCGFISLMGD